MLGRMVRRSRGALPAVEPLTPSRYAATASALGPGETAFLDVGTGMASGLAPGADRDTGPRPGGAGRRRAVTGHGPADARDPRRPSAGSNVAWASPPHGGSDLAWNTDSGTSDGGIPGVPGSSAAGPPTRRGSPRSRLPEPADAAGPTARRASPRSRLPEPAGVAGTGGPNGPGLPARRPEESAELPANWLRPAGQPGIPPAGDWSALPGETADSDGDEPGLPLAAGSRGARRAGFRPTLEGGGSPGHRPEPVAAASNAEPPPALTITIGHIEVRAAAESRPQAEQARPARPPRQQFRPQVSLAEFLGRDGHGPPR